MNRALVLALVATLSVAAPVLAGNSLLRALEGADQEVPSIPTKYHVDVVISMSFEMSMDQNADLENKVYRNHYSALKQPSGETYEQDKGTVTVDGFEYEYDNLENTCEKRQQSGDGKVMDMFSLYRRENTPYSPTACSFVNADDDYLDFACGLKDYKPEERDQLRFDAKTKELLRIVLPGSRTTFTFSNWRDVPDEGVFDIPAACQSEMGAHAALLRAGPAAVAAKIAQQHGRHP